MAASLFQYEKLMKNNKRRGLYSSMTTGLIGSFQSGSVITRYNSEYNTLVIRLRDERDAVVNRLTQRLTDNPHYIGMRNNGVGLAWKYEKADVQMGGKGSANWNRAERKEIMENGAVRGAEGHHGKSVSDHPDNQADPDNIRFYKSRENHLNDGHDGDWRNSSKMDEIDKERMLRLTNTKRVVRRELTGVAITAGVAFGIGASIEIICTLAREGISPGTVKQALKNGVKAGLQCAAFAVGTYIISRMISFALQKVVGVSAAWANAIASPIITAVFAGIECYMLIKNGYSVKEALKKATFHAAIRIAIWALGFIPYCGGIISIVATVIYTGIEVALSVKEIQLVKELEFKTVEWLLPAYV